MCTYVKPAQKNSLYLGSQLNIYWTSWPEYCIALCWKFWELYVLTNWLAWCRWFGAFQVSGGCKLNSAEMNSVFKQLVQEWALDTN